jgi:hypothetical protein
MDAVINVRIRPIALPRAEIAHDLYVPSPGRL